MKAQSLAAFAATVIIMGIDPAFAVDEIIVTAQRREAKLQDVPLAVSAFDGDTIAKLQINVVKDIGQNVPNLQAYTVTAGTHAMQLHSRGASVQNPGFNAAESPVGIYQDDVYFGRLASANLDLADIERIEVLRGPQGTLYGRNTIAGAIKIISRTPGNDAWANGSIGLGNYDTFKVTGSVGGPVRKDALGGSLAFLYDNRNQGWQDNPTTGSEPGEHENLVMRGKLRWFGTDNFNAVLSVWGADLDNDGYNGVPYDAPPDASGKETGGPPGGGFYDTLTGDDRVNYGSSDQAGASLDLAVNLGGVTLRSITAFNSIDDEFGFDLSGGGGIGLETGNNGLLAASDSSMDTWSEELQLLGNAFGGSLDWLLGAYYQNEDGEQSYAGNLAIPDFGPLDCHFQADLDANPDVCFDFVENVRTKTDSYAVFAEGTYHITDRFSVVAGVRYTDDQKKFDDTCTGTTCAGGPVALDESFDETTFKLGADYRLNDQALVYASFSQGFQAGGFQTLCLGDLSAACAGTFYAPQTVDSFEIGLKTDLLGNTLRLNMAGFYAMYDDIQQTGLMDGKFPLINVGEADVYGAELEATWTPVDTLSLYGFLGYQDSDYGRLNAGSTAALTGADELPSNPKLTGKVGFAYTMGVSDLLDFFYGADLYYSDDYYATVDSSLQIDSYARLNGYIGIGEPHRRWQVVLAGRNITDEEDNVSGIYFPGVTNIRTPLPPAEYMLTFRANY